MSLLSLPNDILLQLPQHMRNLEDFTNASSSCRLLHALFARTLPKTILHLAARCGPTFFSPDPDFLALATARSVAAWATASPATRTPQLIEAFRDGPRGILDLALRHDVTGVGLTMDEIRRMHRKRFSVINPLNATLDAMIGKEWYRQPNFWEGGADDAYTLYAEIDGATMQLLLYGELFGGSMESFLRPKAGLPPPLGVDVRIEFVKYCIPDWICMPSHDNWRDDEFEVLPVGPYAEMDDEHKLEGNQLALVHLLGGAMFRGWLWKSAWRRVLIAAGAFENDDGGWPEGWRMMLEGTEYRRQRYGDDEQEEWEEWEGFEEGEQGQEEKDETEEGDDMEQADAGKEDNVVEEDNAVEEDDTEDETEAQLDNWRFKLFWKILTQTGGLEGMEMVAQFKGREEGKEVIMRPEWKARITHIRDQVLALEDEERPGSQVFGKHGKLHVSHAPDLANELYLCCAGMWCGL